MFFNQQQQHRVWVVGGGGWWWWVVLPIMWSLPIFVGAVTIDQLNLSRMANQPVNLYLRLLHIFARITFRESISDYKTFLFENQVLQ